MLTTALCCSANEVDVTELVGAATAFLEIFQQKPNAAKELINVGDSAPDATLNEAELAAWTMVANTLMNRDDFINK